MGCLREFYGILVGFLCGSYAIFMVYPWSFYGISLGFLWDFHDISMIFLLDSHEIFLRDSSGLLKKSMVLRDFFGISMVVP